MSRNRYYLVLSATLLIFVGCRPLTNPVDPESSAYRGTLSQRIVDLSISPEGGTYQNAGARQFEAFALFEDGSRRNVTDSSVWVSENRAVVTFSDVSPGLAMPAGSGVTDVYAEYLGISSRRCNSIATFELQVLFVSTSGSDATGSGTRAAPFETISHAVSQAAALGMDDVLVAEGLYETTPIVMEPGVSIQGGFDPVTWEKNYSFGTIVRNSATSGGTYLAPNAAFLALDPAIGTDTVIADLAIWGGTGDNSAGIHVRYGASPTIRDNVIHANSGARSWGGVFVWGSAPVIRNNRIYGDGVDQSTGIHNVHGATPAIHSNFVDGGVGNNRAEGISNYAAGPLIVNNLIVGGVASTTLNPVAGIESSEGSTARIWNNIIVAGINGNGGGAVYGIIDNDSNSDIVNNIIHVPTSAAGTRAGVFEESVDSDPVRLLHNVVYGDLTAFYVDEGSLPRTLSSDLNDASLTTQVGPSANNRGDDPMLVQDDPLLTLDLRFSGATTLSFTQGGFDLSSEADFPRDYKGDPVDYEGNPRTLGWSFGAFEVD